MLLLLLPLPSPRGLRERGSAQRGTRSRPPRAWRSRSAPGKRRQHAKEMKPFERSRSRSTPPKSPRRSPPRRRRQPRLDCGVGDTRFDWLSAPPARLSEQFGSRGGLRDALLRRCSDLGGSFGAEMESSESCCCSSEEKARRRRSSMNSLLPPQSACPRSLLLLRPAFSGSRVYFLSPGVEVPLGFDETTRKDR